MLLVNVFSYTEFIINFVYLIPSEISNAADEISFVVRASTPSNLVG